MINTIPSNETQVVFPLFSGKRVIITITIISVRIRFGFISLIQENWRKSRVVSGSTPWPLRVPRRSLAFLGCGFPSKKLGWQLKFQISDLYLRQRMAKRTTSKEEGRQMWYLLFLKNAMDVAI